MQTDSLKFQMVSEKIATRIDSVKAETMQLSGVASFAGGFLDCVGIMDKQMTLKRTKIRPHKTLFGS